MAYGEPLEQYRDAVARLENLTNAVAAQIDRDEVEQAILDLRIAVQRVYGRTTRVRSGGGRRRILDFLSAHLNEWVDGEELALVSGIGEWARRVRELRVEYGYRIEEEAGRYRLMELAPDKAKRERYLTVTAIRNEDIPALDRVRRLVETFVGLAVTPDEVSRVAHGRDGERLIRELRTRELLPVEFSADAPDLQDGEYRLASTAERHRLHPAQSLFSEDARSQVFRRDRYACSSCGRRYADGSGGDPFFLLVRHLDAGPDGLRDLPVERLTDFSRLVTSCNRCAI